MSGIVEPKILEYLESLHPAPDPVAAAMEEHAERERIPILSRETARFLGILAGLIGARTVVEVGTAIGYSTLHLARALPEGGRVVTIDISRERQEEARRYLGEAGVVSRVRFETGPALEVLPRLREEFRQEGRTSDLLFLDAVKEEYAAYLEEALPMVRPGGAVVVDNLLWSGRVAGPAGPATDAATRALREFNRRFLSHPLLAASVLPIGDGTGLAIRTA